MHVDSKSTDKLALLTSAAEKIMVSQPDLGKRITRLDLSWSNIGGAIVPIIKIEFNPLVERASSGIVL